MVQVIIDGWHDVTLWGKAAETAAQVVAPSSRVLVTGTVREREYEYQDEKRKKLEVTASSVGGAQVVKSSDTAESWG